MLKLNEIFHSIQGEGPFAGTPAIFIRFAGCNLSCNFCDTEFSEKMELKLEQIIDQVAGLVVTEKMPLVVITGGEPFLQHDIEPLIDSLVELKYPVQVESNGTVNFKATWAGWWNDWTLVVSPKPGAEPVLRSRASALKYVLRKGEFPNLYMDFDGEIYLQPCDDKDPVKNQENLDWVKDLCLQEGFKLSLQLHKLLGVR